MNNGETIKWLESLKAEIGKSEHRTLWHYAEAIDMAIEALHQPPNDDWERYADFLWKEAYERGKQEALKGGDRYDK